MKGYVNISADRVILATLNRKHEYERLDRVFKKFKSDRIMESVWSWFLFIPYKTNNYKKFCVEPFGFNCREIKKRWPESYDDMVLYSNRDYANAKRIREAAQESSDGLMLCSIELAQMIHYWADFK